MGEGSASVGAAVDRFELADQRRAPAAALRRLPDPLLQAPVVARPEGPRAPRPAGRGARPPPARRGPRRRARPTSRSSTRTWPPNGWQSAHTVVQVVTDDMPFLVDSVRMVMTAMGLGIHLVIHPMLRVVRDDGTYVRCRRRDRPTRPGCTSRSTAATPRAWSCCASTCVAALDDVRRRGDRLAADAGPLRPAGPRAGAQRAAARHGRGEPRRAVPALAQRRPPRLPRLPRVRLRPRGRGRRRRGRGARHRSRPPPGRPADGGAAPAVEIDARGPADGVLAGGR